MSVTTIFLVGLFVSTLTIGGFVFSVVEIRRLAALEENRARNDGRSQAGRR